MRAFFASIEAVRTLEHSRAMALNKYIQNANARQQQGQENGNASSWMYGSAQRGLDV
jgi:hypothetical protein